MDRKTGNVEIEGKTYYVEYRYGSHPNKGGYDKCLYLPGQHAYGDDKFRIKSVRHGFEGDLEFIMSGHQLCSNLVQFVKKFGPDAHIVLKFTPR